MSIEAMKFEVGGEWKYASKTPKQSAQQSCYCPNCEALSKELAALKAAQQEPVYFCDYGYEGWGKVDAAMAAENRACGMTVEAYYTRPQAREPLTDRQRQEIRLRWQGRNWSLGDIIDAVEAAHGIK